jgi:hypothetical protein
MATSSDWTVATVRVIQGGETIGSKVQLLKPGKKSKIKIKLLSGAHFAKGSAVIHVATYTVEGVQQLLKKPITVK